MNALLLTKKLISIDSTNPGNYEVNMHAFLKNYFEAKEFDCAKIEKEEVFENRENLMVEISGNSDDKELVFICHMDTVPVWDGWTKEPFVPIEEDGLLFGRGSCDMKSGMACALIAVKHAAKLKAEGKLKRTIKFIATVDEEGDMIGVEHVIESGWVTKKSLVLDTEPTSGQIQGSHKGRAWFKVIVHGVASHASMPWEGVDAVATMAEIIRNIRLEIAGLKHDEKMGDTTVAFGTVHGGTEPYEVPDYCQLSVDIRLVYPYTMEDAKTIIENSIKKACNEIKGAKAEYIITGDKPSIKADEESELALLLKSATKKVTGKEAECSCFTGYTDTGVIATMTGNKNCFSFGPGNLKQAHKPDEYVRIGDIETVEKVLCALVDEF